jgi:16S rRNA processing protein RimM
LLLIGKISGIHGMKGNLKVTSYAQSFSDFAPGSRLAVNDVNGRSQKYTISWIKPHNRVFLLSFTEISDRITAEALVGAELFIERQALDPPEAGTYYWADLIGLSVYTTSTRSFLGRLEAIIPTAANDVYVVKDGQKETLVPALASVVTGIDLQEKIMQVDLPDGLLGDGCDR